MSQTSIAAILSGRGSAGAERRSEPTSDPALSKTPIEALARTRELDELERIRLSVHAAGQTAYHWHIASDRLTWAGDLASVANELDPEALNTGRAYAHLLDRDSATSRYDAVMGSSLADEGEGVPYSVEYRLKPFGHKDERALWVEDTGRWFSGPGGKPAEAFGMIRRIDDRYRRDQQLKFLGGSDPLTGMMNRSRLGEALGEALAVATRDGTSFAFLIAAVNNLPVVNDAYGFDIADEVIASLGRRLRRVVRAGDSIGRYSGSKFGIILANCSEADLEVAAERFLSVARDSVIESEKGPVWAILSMGGIILPKHASEPNAAMAQAEEALAEAKRQPTDSFVLYKPSPELISMRNLNARCGAEIVASLREDRFALAYQPIVRATTGETAMHEALLRMMSHEGDPVAAVHLVPIAEKLGLVRLIDRAVMGLAISDLYRHSSARVSLNVSGVTATDPRWFGLLTDIIRSQPEVSDRLIIEITETIALNELQHTKAFIDQLRELGCKVAIDDFGAGYTSFRNLQILDVDLVKIDGAFCERLSENQDNQYFVRSLIDLARKFDIETVAEWVQSEADAELLREWGVDYLQGTLFGDATITRPWAEETHEASGEPFRVDLASLDVLELRTSVEDEAKPDEAGPVEPDAQVKSSTLQDEPSRERAELNEEAETPGKVPDPLALDFSQLRQALAELDTFRRA